MVVRSDSPDTHWEVLDLGQGLTVRYYRTVTNSSQPIGGTAGYKYGVDLHDTIHCAECCCSASADYGCDQPAAGTFTIGIRYGHHEAADLLRRTAAECHLRDPVRHP